MPNHNAAPLPDEGAGKTNRKTPKPRGQMSDAWSTVAFLTLSGGFQDAYTFFTRGRVFANAQTGNIVLMSERLFHGDWAGGLRYLVPLTAFALGVFVAERVRRRCRAWERLHWRQLVVLGEIAMLGLVGFLPDTMNLEANALVSFACAMQVQAFRKVNGYPYASTMCIGNLRSGMEALEGYLHTREKTVLHKALHYFGVVLLFALGAGLGSVVSPAVGTRAIWFCCAGLLVSFALMSLKEQTA
jgi:uncharacterized membrane protein YoaK (UPF0700 family)